MLEEMASRYFHLIHIKLHKFWRYDDGILQFGVGILEMFCCCLENFDYTYTAAVDDEQGKEISLTSMITITLNHLKSIWLKEDNILEDVDFPWPEEIQDFDPVTFGLEGKIQQSKTLIDQKWYRILVRRSSSMQMKCKSSTNLNIIDFVKSVNDNVHYLLRYKTSQIDPFKYQIDILEDMLKILGSLLSRIRECIDSNELHEYRNFVHAFTYNAACFICIYWAKEANEEDIVTEMNIALCDMLQKIKPFAAHVIVLYFDVLKSNNLLKSDDSVSEGHTIASFVDFFFEHTILEDVFLILRERLIVLFTFLANAPAKEEEEEEDVIRTQIYALFHEEDAYLLLPISVMKQDFSNNKMLLSDCMIKIDLLTAEIIQFNCRPSDSWNRMEAEKMNNIYFASLERELYTIKRTTFSKCVDVYIREIRFLRLFFKCFETWDDRDEETKIQLCSVVTSLQRIWGQENGMRLLLSRLYAIRKEENIADLEHVLDIELKEKFQMSKHEINAWLLNVSHCSFHCMPSTSNKILKFLDSILNNMSDLVSSRACKDVSFKKQNEILEEKLLLLKNLLYLATNCSDSKILEDFNMLAQVFSNNATCLIYLYWAKEADDDIPGETNLMLSNMLQKIKPNTVDVARTYIGTLKAICLQPYDPLLLEQTVVSFVDYFFEDLTAPWKNDFKILRDEVIFLLTFVHHHHIGNAEEIICNQLNILFNDEVYELLPFDDMKCEFSKKKVGLTDFMLNIGTENAKIRQLYCKFPDTFVLNFPRMIGQGFLDSLIQKLRNLTERMIGDQKYEPYAKYKIKTIEEELLSLTPIFNKILKLKGRNDAWLEVVNVVYLAEHVIGLCCIFYHQTCYYITYLSDVADIIKVAKKKFEKTDECNMHNFRCLSHSAGLMSTPLLEQDRTSEINGELMGIEVDEKIIVNNIMRGTKSLDIVSIVGMGGLGKTTLAKKVYGSSSIQSHFNICAFTYVSQYHDKRGLLLDILKKVGFVVGAKTSHMTTHDLAHELKKCLSRQKYFIVLDDIWDINDWDEVRSSFPDDLNGSRIMFTTRSLEVAKRGQIKCIPHRLRFLSQDESWRLLQKKVFHSDVPPPNLFSVAKLIAKKCDGLPLAIVVIAGLLARTEISLWIDISKRVSSCLYDEGCMDILELSYKHLPEYLKPCLIYLGAFPEHSSYTVTHVTLLWIAEGFIKTSKTKSLSDVAKEYLHELVDRSLVIVDQMTIGEIRTFRVHDLIHNFCQMKCTDENFFQIGHGTSTCKHYRVSVQKLWDISANAEPSLANAHSLLYFPSDFDYSEGIFPFSKFRFAQVLYLKDIQLQESDFAHVTSLIDLRHIEVSSVKSIPSSISNLWNMQSLIIRGEFGTIDLPESLWRMKSLMHVKVRDCELNVLDGYKLNAYPQLDKVISFSKPHLYSGEDIIWLLQRLPAVRRLNCIFIYRSPYFTKKPLETLDFHSKLESLKLKLWGKGKAKSYLINFPSTLIKLTLANYMLSSTNIATIAELQCLRVLKLRNVSFPGRTTWEMGELTFSNLGYFELRRSDLVLWNANTDSFPCLEQLFFVDTYLEELPSCFGEISSLNKITIWYSPKLTSSALRVQEEHKDFGNNVELEIILEARGLRRSFLRL